MWCCLSSLPVNSNCLLRKFFQVSEPHRHWKLAARSAPENGKREKTCKTEAACSIGCNLLFVCFQQMAKMPPTHLEGFSVTSSSSSSKGPTISGSSRYCDARKLNMSKVPFLIFWSGAEIKGNTISFRSDSLKKQLRREPASKYRVYTSERTQPLGLSGSSSSRSSQRWKRKRWRLQLAAPCSCSSRKMTASWMMPIILGPPIPPSGSCFRWKPARASRTPSVTARQATGREERRQQRVGFQKEISARWTARLEADCERGVYPQCCLLGR